MPPANYPEGQTDRQRSLKEPARGRAGYRDGRYNLPARAAIEDTSAGQDAANTTAQPSFSEFMLWVRRARGRCADLCVYVSSLPLRCTTCSRVQHAYIQVLFLRAAGRAVGRLFRECAHGDCLGLRLYARARARFDKYPPFVGVRGRVYEATRRHAFVWVLAY